MTISYCTDETIAVIDAADFGTIAPADQILASAADGVIGPDGWTLTSESCPFEARGLASGHVVRVTGPREVIGPTELEYAVDSAEWHTLRLRQKGQPAGTGQPLGPTGTAGVSFRAVTLGPQIARASRDLEQRFGISNILTGQTQVQLFDPKELEELTGLFVLYRQFLSLSRVDGQGYRQTTKAEMYKEEYEERLARAVIHWKPLYPSQPTPTTTRFGCRLSR